MAADKITGIWEWDAESRPDPIGSIVTFVVRKGETRFERYHGELFVSGKAWGFKVFGDRDDSETLNSGDKYLGKMFPRKTPDFPVYSGTFKLTELPGVARGYSLGGFIGEANLGNWFE